MKRTVQLVLWSSVVGIGASGILNAFFVIVSGLGRPSFGNLLPAIVGTVFVTAGVRKLRRPEAPVIPNRGLQRIVKVLGMAAALWLLLVLGLMLFAWQKPVNEAPAWIIVPGAGLRGDQLSLTLKARLDTAVKLGLAHPEARMVVSGGQGRDEALTEAEAMARYLEQTGIAPDRILQERRATSTYENMAYSKAVMQRAGWLPQDTAVVVSSRYHLFRAQGMARELGIAAWAEPAPVPASVWLGSWLREMLAVTKYLMTRQ